MQWIGSICNSQGQGLFSTLWILFIHSPISTQLQWQPGLLKCGERILYAIACSDSLADALVELANPAHNVEHAEHLRFQWRHSLIHYLRTDPQKRLGRVHDTVIASVETSPLFASLAILGMYLDPVTTQVPMETPWIPCPANLPALIQLCKCSFAWGSPRQMTERFLGIRNLWPSLVRSGFFLVSDVLLLILVLANVAP